MLLNQVIFRVFPLSRETSGLCARGGFGSDHPNSPIERLSVRIHFGRMAKNVTAAVPSVGFWQVKGAEEVHLLWCGCVYSVETSGPSVCFARACDAARAYVMEFGALLGVYRELNPNACIGVDYSWGRRGHRHAPH